MKEEPKDPKDIFKQIKLSDKTLVSWIKKEYKNIPFISTRLSHETHERTTNLFSAIESLDEDKALYQQTSEVSEVWRNLLGKAIVFLKYSDRREIHHDDEDYGVEKLDKLFKTFREFEPLLYGAEDARYRDHIAHMFSVFLAGDFLVRSSFGFNNIEIANEQSLGPEDEDKITDNEKEAMWCVMALTHDLGIALEKITDINPKVRDMLKEFGVINMQDIAYPVNSLPLDEFGLRLISSDLLKIVPVDGKNEAFVHHIQSKYYMKFAEALERRNHGIISCLVLIKNLVFFLETDYLIDLHKPLTIRDAKQFLIRRDILRPIAAHSNENIYYLRIREFPFLLMIFDEIHEWGRPRFVSMFGNEGLTTEVTIKDISRSKLHYTVTFTSKVDLETPNKQLSKKLYEKEIHEYFIRKYTKFRRILRSAVGGELRSIELTLEVINNIDNTRYTTYILNCKDPQTISTTIDGEVFSLNRLEEERASFTLPSETN